MKKWVFALVLLLAIGGVGVWGYSTAMKRAWIHSNEYDIRSEGTLRVGDLAPDLELARADVTGRSSLSDFYRDKPLVMVFGSYT